MFERLEHFYNSKPFFMIVLIRIALFLGLAFKSSYSFAELANEVAYW